jgi:uncharacterized protein (TIGR02145 family)
MTTKIFRKTFPSFLVALAMTALFFCPAVPALAQLQVCVNQGFALVSAEPASGIEPITYEWYENGIPINNSNTASISIAAGKATPGTYVYVRVAANSACTLSSNNYTVEVLAPPSITTQPKSTSMCTGGTVTLSVATSNATAYQWKKNGANVTDGSGGTTANYTTAALTANATYSVVVSNGACAVASTEALITVTNPPPGAVTSTCWRVGAQLWSDAIAVAPAGCTASNNFGTTSPPTTGYYWGVAQGYMYNWKCVRENTALLCPSPWRVPMATDFCELDLTLLARSDCSLRQSSSDHATYVNSWGAVYAGAMVPTLYYVGANGQYWSQSNYDTTNAYMLWYWNNGWGISPNATDAKYKGALVRCVL